MDIDILEKYELEKNERIEDIASEGYLFRHKRSGARVLCISNQDVNKVFYIAFRTLPQNDKGIPHIIEHSILCGSRKYPSKDTFLELNKGSLNSYINAMTYADKTVYPIASCNEKDFETLVDVYLDAVFFPNILENDFLFKQEAWHYELKSIEYPLTLNGVVYNEMKGSYASATRILKKQICKSLFPENEYYYDSGGSPEEIPQLSYDEYIEYYKKFYHPSNAYIYLYGDIDIKKYLRWLDEEYLRYYNTVAVSQPVLQKKFENVKERIGYYSISTHLEEKNLTFLSYNRVIGTATDAYLYQAFDVLDYAIISSENAPVRQALIESGICDDVYSFFEVGLMQPIYSIVAKNTDLSHKKKFVEVIDRTLRKVVRDGLDKDALLAGINLLELEFRQADLGKFPKGLHYGMTCLDSWLYDDSKPYLHLECQKVFNDLRENVTTGYFEKIIEDYLLKNTHGSIVAILPVKGYNSQKESEISESLNDIKCNLKEDERKQIIEFTKVFHNRNNKKSVKSFSHLKISDINEKAKRLNNIFVHENNLNIVWHEIETNEIIYISFMFKIDDLPMEDILYLELLTNLLGALDTSKSKIEKITNEINKYSGGIVNKVNIYPNAKDNKMVSARYEIQIKVMEHSFEHVMQILMEIIQHTDFSNVKRVGQILTKRKTRLPLILKRKGNMLAAIRSMSGFSLYAYYQEMIHGISFYNFLCCVDKKFHTNPSAILGKFEELMKNIFVRERLEISFTGNERIFLKSLPILSNYLSVMRKQSIFYENKNIKLIKKNEAFIDDLQVQCVARTGNFIDNGYAYSGYLQLLKIILNYGYLYENIRAKGGAYGVMSSFLHNGDAYFVSYRDPHLKRTNDVYEDIPKFISDFGVSERELMNYKIGTIRQLDSPLSPFAEGMYSMSAYLQHISYEDMQLEREEILKARIQDIQELAEAVGAIFDENNICVVGGEKIHRYNGLFDVINNFETLN